MAVNPYTSVSVSGYNSSPPADDGSQVAANKVTWAGIKTKLTDPLNTALAAIDAAVTNFGAVASTQGRQTIWIPAGAFVARSTLGATGPVTTESASNKIMQYSLNFTATGRKHAQANITMPTSWNGGTVIAKIYWRTSATGLCQWGIQGVSISDGDTYDAAFGTAQVISDDAPDTTTLRVTGEVPAFTLAGSPAAEDLSIFQIYNDCTSTGHTATGTQSLLGVKLYYTTNSYNDAT